MTQCIDPSDPRYFTQTSDKSYDRHKYQINLTNGKSVVFDDYEIMRAAWFQTDSMFLKSVDVLDKGFKYNESFPPRSRPRFESIGNNVRALCCKSKRTNRSKTGVTNHDHLDSKTWKEVIIVFV